MDLLLLSLVGLNQQAEKINVKNLYSILSDIPAVDEQIVKTTIINVGEGDVDEDEFEDEE